MLRNLYMVTVLKSKPINILTHLHFNIYSLATMIQ